MRPGSASARFTPEEVAREAAQYEQAEVYSARLCAMRTGRSYETIIRLMQAHDVPGIKVGGEWLVMKDDWKAFLHRDPYPERDFDSEELLTAQELARFLGRSYETVLRLFQRGHLPAIKFGGEWLIARGRLYREFARQRPDPGSHQPRGARHAGVRARRRADPSSPPSSNQS